MWKLLFTLDFGYRKIKVAVTGRQAGTRSTYIYYSI